MATIHEALTLGTDELAVDGVLLVAELGDYEVNDKEQKLYPRFELFLQITDTFRRCHRAVPVFNDKHCRIAGPMPSACTTSRRSSTSPSWRDPLCR